MLIFGVSATHHFCSEPLYCGNHEGFGTDGKPRKVEVLAFTGIRDGGGVLIKKLRSFKGCRRWSGLQ